MLTTFNLEKFKPSRILSGWIPGFSTPECSTPSQEMTVSSSEEDSDNGEPALPIPTTMDELVGYIREELGEYGLDSDKVDINRVIGLMENYKSNSSDWTKYAHFDPCKYTRNLVDDGNGEFNLLVLAWGEGQQSPIHDHAGSHCVMKILDGELHETLFDWPDKEATMEGKSMECSRNSVYSRDQVTYMSDQLGLHRVSNPSTSKKALSLHLYTPPIKVATTFQESTGAARKAGSSTLYSIRGEKVAYCS